MIGVILLSGCSRKNFEAETTISSSQTDVETSTAEQISESLTETYESTNESQAETEKVTENGKKINYNGWHVWADELQDYKYIYDNAMLMIKKNNSDETFNLVAYELTYVNYSYDELKESEDMSKWQITMADCTFEEYIDGEVGTTVYKYEEKIGVESDKQPREGYVLIYGTSGCDTVWYIFMPLDMNKEDVDAFAATLHLEYTK